MSILSKINSPLDLKKLSIDELKVLSNEIREEIISVVSNNGGHLSSNLGIVETTIALHYVFDFKNDKIVFDVGHQCYTHKILSDRKDKFISIRTGGGISGFPDIEESEYDAFTTGHAGTSISAGLGICEARDRLNKDFYVFSVVGDGSIVNGLNLEAITSSTKKPKKFIVLLNDNGMSISKNRNGLYNLISQNTVKAKYVKGKTAVKKALGNSKLSIFLSKIKSRIKRILNKNFDFEDYGFKYVGVLDGNNIEQMIKVLTRVKHASNNEAILLHVKTQKGKGLKEAEDMADIYHGVGKKLSLANGIYGETLGDELNKIIDDDKNVLVITAAMKDGTGVKTVEEKHPDNFIDVGIAEEFAVTYSAGMASYGIKPVVAIYSTFLQRAYDQILHDVCIPNLPVIFAMDRSGFCGVDGKTHQGLFDLSYLSHLPNMHIFAPCNSEELRDVLRYSLTLNSPVAIRYPNTREEVKTERISLIDNPWQYVEKGKDGTIIAVGPRMLNLALKTKEQFKLDVSVINARTVKPLDTKILDEIKDGKVITLEENVLNGGFGSTVKNYLLENNTNVSIKCFGVDDTFVCHDTIENQLIKNGITLENIAEFIKN